MTSQAESERYLNAASLVHGCGKENIRPADDIVSEKVSDKKSPSAWASLGEGGKNGSQASGPPRLPGICSRHAINSGPIRRRGTHTGP